jgi:hypothetical protein
VLSAATAKLFSEESYFCTITPNRNKDSGELRQGVGRREETLQTAFAGRLEQPPTDYKQNSGPEMFQFECDAAHLGRDPEAVRRL